MANLYNKAGLVNIPIGYSNGFLYNIKPTDNTLAFRFNRDSSATRVNKQGLIEQVSYFGPELVTNGNFDTDTDWTKETGWTISNGVASHNGVAGAIYQINNSIISGKTYKISLTVLNVTSGTLTPFIAGTNSNLSITQNGSYSAIVVAGSGSRSIDMYSDATFAGSIDNVSVVEVLGDKPRIDYTDSLTSPSFLLEPQSTNLITYSEGYSQWTWGGNSNPNNTTRVDNQSSPDGGLNASLFTRNSGTSGWFSPQNITVSLNNTFTYSIFVKKNNSSTITLLNVSNSPQSKVVYDIDLNTFTTETNATGNSLNYGNGWYRISMTFEHTNSGGTSAQIRHTLEEGKSMFVFGSQAEQKSFVTSYIPTFGSASTRAAETCNGAGNASTFNSTEGVLYAEIAALANQANYRYIALTDGTTNNRVDILYRGDVANRITSRLTVGGAEAARFDITIDNELNYNKFALSWKQNEVKFFINGTQQGSTDTNANVPPANTLNELMFNRGDGNQQFFGKTKGVYVFNEALTDDELQQLTGPDYNSFAALAAAYNYTVI